MYPPATRSRPMQSSTTFLKFLMMGNHTNCGHITSKLLWQKRWKPFCWRGVFNTRPRDFYDAYILTTTQKFDKAVFAEALRATADHRGTTQRIADVPAILHDIEENPELQIMWNKYRRQFAYAKEIEYISIITVLRQLLL